jgi:hypothetical protein
MLVHVNVNVPEKEWSHALKGKVYKAWHQSVYAKAFRRDIRPGEVANSVNQIKEGTTLHDGSSCY